MQEIEELFGRGLINHLMSQLVAMGLTIFIIPGLYVTSFLGAIKILIAIALVNAFFWDASLFFALPQGVTITSFQLILANGGIFLLLVKFLSGIEMKGILPALLAPCLFSIISALLHEYGRGIDWLEILSYLFTQGIEIKDYFLSSGINGK
jgi:uncharacterized membrane protein YvlD (DUF360 family)